MNLFDISVSKKSHILLISAIFLLGLLFRISYFDHITFGYDQARDIFMAKDIVQQDHVKILGPATQISGLNTGSLYWYLLVPAIYLGGGSVYAVKIFMILLNLLCIPLLYYITKKITKNSLISYVSIFIFAVSFDAVQYARWLANPTPNIFGSLLLFYSFWLLFNKKTKGIYLFLVAWPFAVQMEFFFTYFIFYFIIFLLLYRKEFKFQKKPLFISSFISMLFLSTFVLAELKYKFRGFLSLFRFIFSSEKPVHGNIFNQFLSLLSELISTVYFNIGGINHLLSGVFFIGLILFLIIRLRQAKQRNISLFLIFWIFTPIILYAFEKISVHYLVLGSLYGIILSTAICIVYFMTKFKSIRNIILLLCCLFIFVGNFILNNNYSKKGEVLFSVQDDMLLNKQIEVLNWIYKESGYKLFAINTVTNPLYMNTVWAYLFDWYGRQKYGYMPAWYGYPQDGVLGYDVKMGSIKYQIQYGAMNNPKGKLLFLIKEPSTGIPDIYYQGYSRYEDTRSKLIETKKFGNFIVEKRLIVNEKNFLIEDFTKTVMKK